MSEPERRGRSSVFIFPCPPNHLFPRGYKASTPAPAADYQHVKGDEVDEKVAEVLSFVPHFNEEVKRCVGWLCGTFFFFHASGHPHPC